MYFEEGGIDLKSWQAKLAQGDAADKTQFLEIVKKLNLVVLKELTVCFDLI